jgi:type III secretion system low calcium response chaperone LcrH/SycD
LSDTKEIDAVVASVEQLKSELEALPSQGRLSNEDAQAIYALAYQSVAQARFDEAYRYFSLLTLYKPTDVAYLGGLALTYKMLKRYQAALSVYSFMAAIDAPEPQHSLSIAECLLLMGEYDEARITLDRVARYCQSHAGHAKAGNRAAALASMLTPGAGSA